MCPLAFWVRRLVYREGVCVCVCVCVCARAHTHACIGGEGMESQLGREAGKLPLYIIMETGL